MFDKANKLNSYSSCRKLANLIDQKYRNDSFYVVFDKNI